MNKKQIQKILETRDKIVNNPIIKLKLELEKEDYKIIKCMEHQLLNKELPYDIEDLHNKRNAIREEINKLEKKEG